MTAATNDNQDNGFKNSTTYQFLQNLKIMPEHKAMEIWKWQNARRKQEVQS